MDNEITGLLMAFSEQGTEGIHWIVQDERHIRVGPDGNPVWSYDGMHPLRRGDHLTILDKTDGSLLWEGVVNLTYKANAAGGIQVIDDWVVHGIQRGVQPKLWLEWFKAEHRARLVPHGAK